MNNNRPTSPHLSIYKPQITSLMSISHRISGVVLFGAIIFFVIWLSLFTLSNFNSYYFNIVFLVLNRMALYFASFALVYHMLNGIRHICFDMGYFFKLKEITSSGVFVIISTCLTWIFLWFCI